MTDSQRPRDRSRSYDVVLFGATGFTGRLVAEYLLRHYGGSDLRVALAGRSREKLEAVRDELAAIDGSAKDLPILLGDSFDQDSLEAIAADASVVCTTVGPYAKFGEGLVAACARHGTDYCDLTGEVQFIRRMIDAHHEEAQRTGARIVCCCGFDSIPSDLGTWMMVEAMRERGLTPREVRSYAGETKGGFSGGTVASILNIVDEVKADRSVLRILGNPYALYPKDEPPGADGADQRGVRYDDELGMWTGPFLMAAVNTRIVRRTNALLDFSYGRDFRYSEQMSMGGGPAGLARASAVTAFASGFMAAAALPPSRYLLERLVVPPPGQGPDKEAREKGFFVFRYIAKGETPSGDIVTLRGRSEGKSDPGYGETAKMLGESAVCLALDGASLEAEGGVRTPASTMGGRLLARLRDADMVFRVE